MNIEYVTSIGSFEQIESLLINNKLPNNNLGRIAFVGRSNVGKSSLINALSNSKVANISKQPGKTRKLNFFNWQDKKMIVDMPGYGFSKRSKQEEEKWNKLIALYFENDVKLEHVLLLWDSRHGPTSLDLKAFEFLHSLQKNIIIVFTKFDTLKTQKIRFQRKKEINEFFKKNELNLPCFFTSSKENVSQLRSFVLQNKR